MKKALLWLMLPCLLFSGCADDEFAAVGFIGGADGPTQTFVTSDFALMPFALMLIAAVILIVVGIVVFLHNRK